MNITRKLDRARQWAGEKMGAEAKATHTDEFKALEAEMDARHEGMERLHKSMNIYAKWLSRRCDSLEDRNRSTPLALLGRNMAAHGAELEEHDSEFGRCLGSMGSANERIAELQTTYVDCANATWLQQVERNLAMMKEYQSARKKLESRRLAYDATMGKMQKAKKDDFRLEEELRVNKTKFDDTTEDVFQRMQDVKEAEADTVAALTSFLDAELEYHERAANELRRLRQAWATGASASRPPSQGGSDLERIYSNVSTRSQPLRGRALSEASESLGSKLTRSLTVRAAPPPPPPPPSSRPPVLRSATFEARHTPTASSRVGTGALARAATDSMVHGPRGTDDVFGDDASTCSGDDDNSPGWRDNGISPATSYGSFAGSSSTIAEGKKAPPPPVNRGKKPPPPPVPARKAHLGH